MQLTSFSPEVASQQRTRTEDRLRCVVYVYARWR